MLCPNQPLGVCTTLTSPSLDHSILFVVLGISKPFVVEIIPDPSMNINLNCLGYNILFLFFGGFLVEIIFKQLSYNQ